MKFVFLSSFSVPVGCTAHSTLSTNAEINPEITPKSYISKTALLPVVMGLETGCCNAPHTCDGSCGRRPPPRGWRSWGAWGVRCGRGCGCTREGSCNGETPATAGRRGLPLDSCGDCWWPGSRHGGMYGRTHLMEEHNKIKLCYWKIQIWWIKDGSQLCQWLGLL